MGFPWTYRRPAYVCQNSSTRASRSFRSQSVSSSVKPRSAHSSTCGIPEALAFERVISGGACPPCTTRDFLNYLRYVEHSAENLQFYLWFRAYVKRFDALPASEKVLSQPWGSENPEAGSQLVPKTPRSGKTNGDAAAILAGFDTPRTLVPEKTNPFEDDFPSNMSDADNSTLYSSIRPDVKKTAAAAFELADVKFQPFTVQPFREEITRIIAIYIADGGPRQLNLAARERTDLLQALAVTTHPSAFHGIVKTVEWTLRHQAHPNFIRWVICNGNPPRVWLARFLGIAAVVASLICFVLLTLSGVNRGWRAIAAIPLLVGVSTLYAAWKGMCVILHGMHHRHLRPWEMFVDDDQPAAMYEMKLESQDTISSSNSYEDEPWVAKYEKRNLLRKAFDRQVWIQEPALRQIQDAIFVQALLLALLTTAVVVGVFVALPYFNII